jgi:hypothetical protein
MSIDPSGLTTPGDPAMVFVTVLCDTSNGRAVGITLVEGSEAD